MKTFPLDRDTILREHLEDFDIFLQGVKKVLEHPEQFGIGEEE